MKWLIPFIFITVCFLLSCEEKQPPTKITQNYSDSLLFNYVTSIFDSAITLKEFNRYLERQRIPSKEVIIYPGKFRLRKYEWGDGQGYNPFAIEVRDSNDKIIDYFAFGDELFYMSAFDTIKLLRDKSRNIIGFSTKKQNKYLRDSSLLNLKSELSSLIKKLGYQNNVYQIRSLLEIVFGDLLQMQEIKYFPNILDFRKTLIKINRNHILDSSIKEFYELIQYLDMDGPYAYRCKEGSNGYWQLSIEENSDNNIYIEPHLFGSQFYTGIYW